MQTITLRPRKIKSSLYKLHLKENITTSDFEKFEQNLKKLIIDTEIAENGNQTEEHIKNLLQIFLEKTYYENRNYINTMSYKGQNEADLVIHSGKEHDSKVSVIIEAKKPKNKSEMPTYENIFKKAFFEAILYYLWEAVDKQNLEVKNIVITNIYEYFIFDARDIKRIFIDKYATLESTFMKWRNNQLTDNKTDTMYQEIEKYINNHLDLFDNLRFTYFDIRKIGSEDLKYLYKIFSPKHLLREVLANDSNSLNKEFYNELLHIIGLEEVEKNGKKVIQKKEVFDSGSLLENTINVIDSKDKLENVDNISNFGEDKKDRIYNVSLSLCIGWVNRILFLKLLEGQLYKYHGFDKSYKFLDSDKINSFDKLNRLFFSVLAKKTEDRRTDIQNDYFRIPYLNSSLFEMSKLENQAIDIGQLENNLAIPVYKNTVLTDNRAKKLKGELPNLKYLLDFLNSYDFGSEGENQLNQDNKTLINASVLGLIFEKINGYKDGSFYTPGFITTYMCRESIQRAVLQKFNDKYGWICETTKDLYNKIDNIKEANEIVNSLKICDPAVGSGHFLVSALNEIIALKSELGILCDTEGKKLRDYKIENFNDELVITDEDDNIFEYKVIGHNDIQPVIRKIPKDKTRIQKALFFEKKHLIENCLFGVDINNNSVMICRLRLWIELLKSAFYTEESNFVELETLPNIDINIKHGNSLISRFDLDENLKTVFNKKGFSVKDYREKVRDYKETNSKEKKKEVQSYIEDIKGQFKTEITNKELGKIHVLENQINQLNSNLFGVNKEIKKEIIVKQKVLDGLLQQKEEVESSVIYKDAFEWRFEFPEVLDNDGNFSGFDCIVGNPPYIGEKGNKEIFHQVKLTPFGKKFYQRRMDFFYFFIAKGIQISKNNSLISYITTNYWITATGAQEFLRPYVKNETNILKFIDFGEYKVFDSAQGQHNSIFLLEKTKNNKEKRADVLKIVYPELFNNRIELELIFSESNGVEKFISQTQEKIYDPNTLNISFLSNSNEKILDKIISKSTDLLENLCTISGGVSSSADRVRESNLKHCSSEEIIQNNIKLEDGIFILSEQEFHKANFTKEDTLFIKPYFKSTDIQKWITNEIPNKFLIYAHHVNAKEIEKSEKLYNHFKKFETILKSRSQDIELEKAMEKGYWFVLTNGRPKLNFDIDKIVCPYRTKNILFGYNNLPWYAGRDVYYLLDFKLCYKFLLAILNSKLISFWLKNKGKVKGDLFEIYPEPLKNIPIYFDKNNSSEFSGIVDKILENKKQNIDTSDLESQIDEMVYKLYELTPEEIAIIEGK